jgi:hypothetical protein
LTPRLALASVLGLATLNLLLTTRWAPVIGSLNGPKRPLFVAALVVAWILTLSQRGFGPVRLPILSRVTGLAGILVLAVCFFHWFPIGTWQLIPFLDDWPPRFHSTVQGLNLLGRGAFVGWNWSFLGGYHLSSDVTQSLTVVASIPMMLFGEALGFHLVHLLLFLALPALVFVDLKLEGRDDGLAWLAAGLVAICATNYSQFLLRSGDTNSLAGVFGATLTLTAAHAARRGHRSAPAALVCALTLTNYCHRGFFAYTILFLLLDAAVAHDRQSLVRTLIAVGASMIAGWPITWESWRYPAYFTVTNTQLEPSFDMAAFLRQVYYNAELFVLPGRWFADYTGLARIFIPVVAVVAWKAGGRARFHACALLTTLALTCFRYESFGYVFARPIHMLPIFAGPSIAWFILSSARTRRLALAVLGVVAIYILPGWLVSVPHVRSLRDFDAALVDRVSGLDGHLVLLENNFHRDVDVEPHRSSEPSRFGTHFEALMPEATGKFFYAGYWDGWQWSPYRHQVMANGTFHGRRIDLVPVSELVAELNKWGVRHLVVWSAPAVSYLSRASGTFELRWQQGPWSHFELRDADVRGVRTTHGTATLERVDPLVGKVQLVNVRAGDLAVVRTNYHPSWVMSGGDGAVELVPVEGQLGFRLPRSGTYSVDLVYPRRPLVTLAALLALAIGCAGTTAVGASSRFWS